MVDGKAVVDVTSGWASKINWTNVAGAIASLIIGFGAPEEYRVQILLGVNLVVHVATIVLRTWFTTSVISSSMESKT